MHNCFFFNDTATTEIYTLSLHDALPISKRRARCCMTWPAIAPLSQIGKLPWTWAACQSGDRKSTRLNSSHSQISYAVFCLKKTDHPVNAWFALLQDGIA